MAQEPTNPFILRKKFPDVKSILRGGLAATEGYQDYWFVLDASTLLAPYGVEKNSIDKIRGIYTKLLASNQLYVPTHALLEFAENRTSKVSDIFTLIDKALALLPGWQGIDYPILHDLSSFKKLLEFKASFDSNKNQYKELLQDLKDEVINWNWQDPISKMYAEIFKDEIFIDTPDTEEVLLKELESRSENNIPPGFKDKGKSENSAGDFIIWRSILALGKAQNKDIVFVTNDAKADWFAQGNKKAIVTRFELVDEYYRETSGKRFACMSFSSFLEIQGAEQAVVNEVEDAAKRDAVKAELIQMPSSVQEQKTRFLTVVDMHHPLALLSRIPGHIRLFLRGDSKDEYYFLGKQIRKLINNYLTAYNQDKQSIPIELSILMDAVGEILGQMIQASDTIEYEAYRQKRSTQAQQTSLKHLCELFLDIYSDISSKGLYATL